MPESPRKVAGVPDQRALSAHEHRDMVEQGAVEISRFLDSFRSLILHIDDLLLCPIQQIESIEAQALDSNLWFGPNPVAP